MERETYLQRRAKERAIEHEVRRRQFGAFWRRFVIGSVVLYALPTYSAATGECDFPTLAIPGTVIPLFFWAMGGWRGLVPTRNKPYELINTSHGFLAKPPSLELQIFMFIGFVTVFLLSAFVLFACVLVPE